MINYFINGYDHNVMRFLGLYLKMYKKNRGRERKIHVIQRKFIE